MNQTPHSGYVTLCYFNHCHHWNHVMIVVSCDKNMVASFRTPGIPYQTGRFIITSLPDKISSRHTICYHFKTSAGSNLFVQSFNNCLYSTIVFYAYGVTVKIYFVMFTK
jgi:hypothetical protein